MPLGDDFPHQPALTCWCKPQVCEDDPDLINHNAYDGREAFENEERLPS